MESSLCEQSIFSDAIESVGNHAVDLAEKAKSILAAFDAFILPQPKYPELTKEDVALCLQYESEYHQAYKFYRETEKVAELQERQYENIVKGKTLPFSEKAFGYFGLGYEIKKSVVSLNKMLIDTVFMYFDETYGLRLDEPKKDAILELIGDSRSSQTEKLQELSFDMLYAAIKEHLNGHSFDEVAEQKAMESFRSAIRDGNYDGNSHKYIYNGTLKVLCERDKVIYQSGRNLGIGKDCFKGDSCLESFFLGLSKYESGKAELLKCFHGLCKWNGCNIVYNVVTPILGSRFVKELEIYKKGKFIFTFYDAEAAIGFVEFCREF